MKHLNMEGTCIENEIIRLIVLPKLGVKIVSIYFNPQNFKILFQPKRYYLPKYSDLFERYDTSDIDDMFPNIYYLLFIWGILWKKLPDHGEFWSIPWICEKKMKTPLNVRLKAKILTIYLPEQ
ncbi:hypothetical protein SU69_02225 [Thermosipho melanesiensis]|uniref:Uncharacterized protein n=2 Tax=Thermosipho melanesiensis TaxID=46541 RepID=A6LK43_THEM4|nr:hypothetical protein [Thermosipho melanesiensis]ABR30294.1 hypothetical protein Tmel_0427 [Thermosipho melanesiensis BI429]APT74821.1 hypothetical protein BW47_02325 [Thermosipho melanesiensis]OOC37417.1 hypothetical protein SU68_02235 [Thermosipho melanesiensis]OOC39779.1 hypothetical protein SU69_02225 [Thermosipho melanesiensis]OOC39884.1 hypothetical protein SU70_02220 [Thermosipho melanesiensis]